MEIYEKVYDRVKSMLRINEMILPEDSLIYDLGADSLDLVELLMWAEDEFNIDISDEEAEGTETIGELATLIESKRGE